MLISSKHSGIFPREFAFIRRGGGAEVKDFPMNRAGGGVRGSTNKVGQWCGEAVRWEVIKKVSVIEILTFSWRSAKDKHNWLTGLQNSQSGLGEEWTLDWKYFSNFTMSQCHNVTINNVTMSQWTLNIWHSMPHCTVYNVCFMFHTLHTSASCPICST